LRNKEKKSVGGVKAIVYAVIVHIIVIVLLVISFTWRQIGDAGKQEKKDIVKAVVVDNEEVQKEVERLRKEEERKRTEESERTKKLQETKQKTVELEKKNQAEEKRLAELKQKQAEEKKKIEAEKKKALELEKKRLVEAAEKKREIERRQEVESSLQEQLAVEEKQTQAAREARALAEADRFKILIRQKVSRNWVRPPSAEKGLECVVRVRLVPGGEVIDAKVVRGSGNAAFDRSVENAVYKATPLPLPADKQLFEYFRELEFIFKPEE
jgi:colicin import membrane protein